MGRFNYFFSAIPTAGHNQTVEKGAYKLTLRSLYYNTQEAKDIEFEQTATGFVRTTGGTMRKSLRRSMRYITYAPIETISNFTHKVFHSLSEIEE